MTPGDQGERRAAAGKAGAADFPERERVTAGASAARGTRMLRRPDRANVCRAGFAGRGTPFTQPTERPTLASDPRRSLGSDY